MLSSVPHTEELGFERLLEGRQRHSLVALRPGRDHSDLRSGLPLQEVQIFLRYLWQLVELRDALSGCVPSLQLRVDRLDGLKPADVCRDHVRDLAVDPVTRAYGNLSALVQHVHLSHHQPLGAIDHVGVAQQRQVQPSAAPRPASNSTVLLTTGPDQCGRLVMDFGREGPFADTCYIRLGYANNGPDLCRANSGPDYGAA